MREPRIFGHGERAAEIRPVAQVGFVQVVGLGIHGLDLHGNALHVAESEVPEELHGIERREVVRKVGVEFFHFALAKYFGIVLEVVLDERLYLIVFLGLLHGDVIERPVAKVEHVDGAFVLFFGLVLCGERVLCLREFYLALHLVFHGKPELVAQSCEVCLGVFVAGARESVLLRDGVEFFLAQLVEQVVQEPDACDVLGTRCRPGDAYEVALVLVVGARVVELVHVLEHVEVVLEDVHVVPLVLERKRIQDRLPATAELAQRLETAVEVRVVETALACDHLAVPDGDEATLQYGFRFDFARRKSVHLLLVEYAHQEDGALLHLVSENGGRVLADLLAEFLEGFLAHFTLELPET